jgi:isopropylmalate/homocitrate/citramalate synthase
MLLYVIYPTNYVLYLTYYVSDLFSFDTLFLSDLLASDLLCIRFTFIRHLQIQVSLGDTIGTGAAGSTARLLEHVLQHSSAETSQLAVHFHDTYGQVTIMFPLPLPLALNG